MLGFQLLLLGTFAAGLVNFVSSIPRESATATEPVDAIIVLTGAGGRLEEGLALLERGIGQKLFISGVHRGVEVTELFRLAPDIRPSLTCCVELGHDAADTRGNARETAAWASGAGVRSLRLVTSNYHMARSLIEFRRAMPNVVILPHPVPAPGIDFEGWWYRPRILRLATGEYVKLLLALGRSSLNA